ncbi:hypothetical protein D3C72_1830260 [compost metagenome]
MICMASQSPYWRVSLTAILYRPTSAGFCKAVKVASAPAVLQLPPVLGKYEENAAGEPSEKNTMTRRLERLTCPMSFSCLRAWNMPAEELVPPTKAN